MRYDLSDIRIENRVQDALKTAPIAFLRAPINILDLPTRIYNVLRNMGVISIADLVQFQDQELMRAYGFGLSALRGLLEAIENQLSKEAWKSESENTNSTDLIIDTSGNSEYSENVKAFGEFEVDQNEYGLAQLWGAILDRLDGRSRDVLFARMGKIERPKTLAELGHQFGITRERIRQLQKKAIDKIQSETDLPEILSQKISVCLEGRQSPLYLAILPEEDKWFQNIETPEVLLDFLIDQLLGGMFGTFNVHGRRVVSRCSSQDWDNKMRTARTFIEDRSKGGLSEGTLRLAVAAIAGQDSQELADALWEHAAVLAHFSVRNGERILVAYGRGVEQMTTVVLEDSDRPLHYKEISSRVAKIYSAQDVRRVHNAAFSVSHLLGRGIYGLRRHIAVSKSEGRYLASICESIVDDGPDGRQWHSRELLADLVEHEPLAHVLNHYELSALLEHDSSLHYVGRQIWANQSHGRGGVHSRIDIRNAIEAAIEREGRPMTSLELYKRISKIRGLGNSFQVHARGRLIRVGPATWGLLDRDVHVSRANLADGLDRLESILSRRGQALHVTELMAALDWSSKAVDIGWQVLGAAQVDSRFRIFKGDNLGLIQWTNPNRVDVHEAISAAISTLRNGVSLSTVQQIVESRLERATNTDIVKSALRDLGASYDRLNGLWELSPGKNDDDDEDADYEVL